ncbi:MAG TPA: translation initiation factor [Synergistaceae bacterium]|nr:translation initiation factor [Synergistaceae bacterium]
MGKIVLRVQRKGRGGKTVTVLSTPGGGLVPASLEPLAKDIRKALGCGARVEDGTVVIQGDNSERAEKWLLQRGARQVVRGS